MHAASVHPEPGSNSRKMVYKMSPYGNTQYLSFELDCSFTFCLSSILFQELTRSVLAHTSMLCTSLIVVQFSMTERPSGRFRYRSSRQPDYYITTFPLCQYLFQKFFKNFFGVDFVSLWDRRLVDSSYIIAHSYPLCQL